MRFDLEDGMYRTDLPKDEATTLIRPCGPDEWCLTIDQLDLWGDALDAERFIREMVFDAVRTGNVRWVSSALADAELKWPSENAPEPFRIVPGGVA